MGSERDLTFPYVPAIDAGTEATIALFVQGVTEPGEMGIVMRSSNVIYALSIREIHLPGISGSFPDAVISGLNLVEAGQVSSRFDSLLVSAQLRPRAGSGGGRHVAI